MNLKASFCNKSIIKADLKRFWWISVLYTIAIFFLSVFGILERYHSGARFYNDTELLFNNTRLYSQSVPVFVLSLIVPVVIAAVLFLYMQTSKASTFAHSIPVTRKGQFLSHIISGIVLMVLPLLINYLILVFAKLTSLTDYKFLISHLSLIYLVALIYSLVAFSVSVVWSMIAGNGVAAIIFTYGFGFLPVMTEAFLRFLFNTQLFGYHETNEFFVERFVYFDPETLIKPIYMTVYIVLAIALLLLGYVLYKLRDIENHSEAVAFVKLRKVFIYVIGIISGCFGFAYFNAMWGFKNILLILPFGLLGIIASTMIVKKSFRVIKALIKPLLIYTLLIVLIFLVFKFDLSGFERRIPELNSIEKASFQVLGVNQTYDRYSYDNLGERYIIKAYEPELNIKDFENLIVLHKDIVKNKEIEYTKAPFRVVINYTLKNGKNLTREYTVCFDEQRKLLEPIVETEAVRKSYFPILRETEKELDKMFVYDQRIGYNAFELTPDQKMYEELLTALKEDLKNTDYLEFAGRGSERTQIEIHYKQPGHYEKDGAKVPSKLLNVMQDRYQIRDDFKNTIKVLEKYGLYEMLPKPEEIEKIGINHYGKANAKTVSVVRVGDNQEFHFTKVIEDKEEILKIYNYASKKDPFSEINGDIDITYFYENGHRMSEVMSTKDKNLPSCVRYE